MEASFNHFEMNYYETHCFIPVVSSRLQNMESNLTSQAIHRRHKSWFCTQTSFHLTKGMTIFFCLLPSTASLKSAVFWGISQVKNFLLLFLLSTEGRAMVFRDMFRIALFPASAQGRWCCHQAKWLWWRMGCHSPPEHILKGEREYSQISPSLYSNPLHSQTHTIS